MPQEGSGRTSMNLAERSLLLAGRVGTAVGLSMIVAELVAVSVGRGFEAWIYAVCGATLGIAIWRGTGALVRHLERQP